MQALTFMNEGFDWVPSPYLDPGQACRPAKRPRISASSFFADTPWLNVPASRMGNILVEPIFPRGGLLGGSSKPPSKLAALAAARKKAAEEKKQKVVDPHSQDDKTGRPDTATSTAMLDRLSALKKLTLSASSAHQEGGSINTKDAMFSRPVRTYPTRKPSSPEPMPEAPSPPPAGEPAPAQPQGPTAEELTATPSTFAQTMLGGQVRNVAADTSKLSSTKSAAESNSLFTLPYPADVDLKNSKDPFAGPSPDDVVLKAQQQAKGLKH